MSIEEAAQANLEGLCASSMLCSGLMYCTHVLHTARYAYGCVFAEYAESMFTVTPR